MVLLPVLVTSWVTLAAAAPDVRFVVASVANVRERPSASSTLVGKLPIGAEVTVDKCARGFCQVRARRRSLAGWVAEELLSNTPPNRPALLDEAQRSLERACALAPRDTNCLVALEASYRAAGREEKAGRVRKLLERRRADKPAPRGDPRGPAIHDTGVHHGEETHASDGETWWALCGGDFRRVNVSVKEALDAVLDEEDGPRTGRDVSLPCDGFVAVRGVDFLTRGRATPAKKVSEDTWQLGDQRVRVWGEKGAAWLSAPGAAKPQRLGPYDDEGGPLHVLWAGDMNGDGRMDLILDYSDHYNVSEKHLLLSSSTSAGELPVEVATHRDTGC